MFKTVSRFSFTFDQMCSSLMQLGSVGVSLALGHFRVFRACAQWHYYIPVYQLTD